MTKYFLLFLYFATLISFGQKTPATEDKIYDAIDFFTANPTEENLNKLESFSNSLSTKTKDKNELLAIVALNCNKGYYENIFGKISKAISLKQQEIEKLKEYKTVLVDNVVTGKVKIF